MPRPVATNSLTLRGRGVYAGAWTPLARQTSQTPPHEADPAQRLRGPSATPTRNSPEAVMDDNLIVDICFAGVVFIYFYNNPMKHGRWFMMQRFINWLPLGMTYAFLYMGRYNLNVAKNALGPL